MLNYLSLYLKWSASILLLGVILSSARGQMDTVLALPEIEVTAERIDFTDIGKHSEKLDTSQITNLRFNTLATMLAGQTPLYVRTYGNGTLATLGIRGGSSSHTQIIWNGIPIRNPMLGQVDLALIPSCLIDQATIHYGGHGASFGSGAVGGLISMSNDLLNEKNTLQAQVSLGSWDQRSAELKLNYGFHKLRFSTRVFSRYAQNDYRYIISKGAEPRHQVHHRLQDNGLLQEIHYALDGTNVLTGRVWYQKTDRQIPPTSVQNNSRAAQQDDNLRTTLEWQHAGEKFKWQIKSAWLNERINYQDSLILLFTHNQFKTWLAEGQVAYKLKSNLDLAGGLYTERVEGISDNYPDSQFRSQHAAFMTTRWALKNWMCRLQMREELTDETWSPLLLDISTEWSGIKSVVFKTSLGRNYRAPTLNDLYWSPGGNPDLNPEEGWTLEAGVHYKIVGRKTHWTLSWTGYTRKIEEWIMWLPPIKDTRNYWSPINVSEVNSQGFEFRSDYRVSRGDWTLGMQAGVDMVWSTFGIAVPDFQIEPGDQLFYVPVENVSGEVKAEYKAWSVYYQHHFFGPSPGINEEVNAGDVGAAGIGYQIHKSKYRMVFLLEIENVWNVPYRMIERRPMPGRSMEVGMKVSL